MGSEFRAISYCQYDLTSLTVRLASGCVTNGYFQSDGCANASVRFLGTLPRGRLGNTKGDCFVHQKTPG